MEKGPLLFCVFIVLMFLLLKNSQILIKILNCSNSFRRSTLLSIITNYCFLAWSFCICSMLLNGFPSTDSNPWGCFFIASFILGARSFPNIWSKFGPKGWFSRSSSDYHYSRNHTLKHPSEVFSPPPNLAAFWSQPYMVLAFFIILLDSVLSGSCLNFFL